VKSNPDQSLIRTGLTMESHLDVVEPTIARRKRSGNSAGRGGRRGAETIKR
jgi:hypothetical protein